jgi:hypothetical protein
VLGANNVVPKGVGGLKLLPDTFNHEGNVHLLGVHNAKAATFLWTANRRPDDHVILSLLSSTLPKKVRTARVQLNVHTEARHELERISLPPEARNRPIQGSSLAPSLATRKFY